MLPGPRHMAQEVSPGIRPPTWSRCSALETPSLHGEPGCGMLTYLLPLTLAWQGHPGPEAAGPWEASHGVLSTQNPGRPLRGPLGAMEVVCPTV